MKAFIEDKERLLDTSNDLLKTGVYAENLVKVIENTPKDKVFTIGIFGGWGTGKSSIIRTAQEKIEAKYKQGVKFITYDAWKYANDSFRRMFLLKVQQELKMNQTPEMKRFYQAENTEEEPKTVISIKGLVICIVIFSVLLALLWFTPLEPEWKVAVTALGTLLSLIVTLLNGCFYDLKITVNKPALFAPEQFEACFKQMMSKSLKRQSKLDAVWSTIKDFVTEGEASVVGLDKLVIVIDNIDRCPSDIAYQMLTDIKTFLSNEKYNLVFIVPVDDEALKKHLFRRWNKSKDDEVNNEKEEFLRKFFNVSLRIKPHQKTELLHFAHEINKEHQLGYSNDTLVIVAKEFADNPRRIIQLLNNLSGDLALYEEEFATKHETAICAALILREEYPNFYKAVTKNLNLVSKFSEDTIKDTEGHVNESLISFMRVADLTLKQTAIDDLQRIFTNTSSVFSDLPTEIQQSVNTYDAAKVIAFAEANEEHKNTLIDFALEKLNSELKYGASTQTAKWLEFLCRLFQAGLFDSSQFVAIDTALSGYYATAVPVIVGHNTLNNMASQMNKAGLSSLHMAIVSYLNDDKSVEKDNFEDNLQSYLKYNTSEKDCDDISTLVEKYYIENAIDKEFDYTDIQLHKLFGDSFFTRQVENLKATDDEAQIEDIVWCIQNNKKLLGESFSALFSKFIELFGNTRGKSKEAFVEFIHHLQPLLDVIGTTQLTDELKPLYDLVTGVRSMPHPSWPSQSQHDTKRSILDEVNEEQAKEVAKFCYDIIRISGGHVNVGEAVKKLYPKCKSTIVELGLKVHSLKISIKEMAATLVQANDYGNANDLSLIEIVLSRYADGGYLVDEKTLTSKIQELVDNSTNQDVEALIGKLIKDEKILNTIIDYVVTLGNDTINTLPTSISKYAVSTFSRENAETYKDNYDYLILVLKNGNAGQKKEVVRLMKTKINNEEDLDNVVLVLDNLATEDQQILKSLVSELDGLKDSENVSDSIKEKTASLATKLSASIRKLA